MAQALSGSRGRRRQPRSHDEPDEPWFGKTAYYCTGGAGTPGKAWPAPSGLTWLPDGGHVAVAAEPGPGPGLLHCPVCGLAKVVGYKTRKRIREARLAEVDISALPF